MRGSFLGLLAALAVMAAVPGNRCGAGTYTWNSTGTDWGTASNWSPAGGPPDANNSDLALFSPNGSSGITVQNPNIAGNQSALSLTVAPNQLFGGWTFGGSGNLGLGGTGSTGLTAFGPATYTFNGPTLQGNSSAALLNFNLNYASTVVLTGNTTASNNLGNVAVNGGTLRLDNSASSTPRLAAVGTVAVSGGGSLELIGNSAASLTENVGSLLTVSNTVSGVNTIEVTPNGQLTILNFANSANNLQPGARAVLVFQAGSGNLGDSNGARITFGSASPSLGAGGLLSATNTNTPASQAVGFAIVKDALGANWATATSAGIMSVANPNSGATITTATDASGLAGLGTSSVAQFNPAPNTTVTASGIVKAASLRITPGGSGASLAMGSNTLQTNALMLDGPNDFAITGTGILSAANSTSKYLHVNDANAVLSLSLVLNSSNSTAPSVVFAGPGFVNLTGTSSQNTLTGANRFVIAGGTVRANDTQVGFTSAGKGVLSLTGGVLEIKNGNNGAGASADFTRAVGAAAGNVTWGAGTANEIGSGGFSAFGSAASVNLGGNTTPTLLQWNSTDFVGTGYALRFGSIQSNAVLTFLNPLQIEQGTNYQLREIQVIAGAGGDRTILAGGISGSASADLLKTGTGTLELSAANTYTGNTWVAGGNLFISGSLGQAALPTGTVTVQNGGTLSGTGTINGTSLVVNSGGTLAPGGLSSPGIFSVSGNVTLRDGSAFSTRIQGAAAGSGYDQLLVTAGNVSLNGLYSAQFSGFTPAGNERLFVISNTSTSGTLTGAFSNYADGAVVANYGGFDWKIYYGGSANSFGGTNGNDVVLVPFAPVPEPHHVLAVCAVAAAVVGLGVRWFRRRLASPV